jgi:opacity protein-like surface antigen
MRKLAVYMLGCALLMAALPKVSGADGFAVSGFGGAFIPLGNLGNQDLETASKTGYQFGGSVEYQWKHFAAGLDGSYNKGTGVFEGDQIGSEHVDKAEMKITQFGAHGKYLIPVTSPVHPYVLLGLGMYQAKYHEAVTDTSTGPDSFDIDNGSHFGVKLGVGANWEFNPMWGVEAEANYNSSSSDKNKGFFFSSLNYMGLTAGITWKMPSHAAK